jgi:hypothetical protein
MANTNLPNIVTSLTDGNLNSKEVADLGDRIILLGTSARGPMNEPRAVSSIEDAEYLFGDISEGTLVRGYSEAYFAPGGPKDIRLVRIGNGNVAALEIEEALGSGLTNETIAADTGIAWKSIEIASKDPGEIFNSASIRQEVVDGQLSVVFYNPVTELETVVPYDPAGLVDDSVANAEELVNALNLDTNFAGQFEANVNKLTTDIAITIRSTDSYVTATGNEVYPSGTITVDLPALLDAADTNKDSVTDDTAIIAGTIPVTCGDKLTAITDCYSLESTLEDLDAAGKKMVTLDNPVNATGGVADDFLMQDLSADAVYDGRGIHVHVGAFIGTGDGDDTVFQFTTYEPIDSTTFKVYRTGPSGVPTEVTGITLDSIGGSGNNNIAQVTLPAAPPLNHIITGSWDSLEFPLTKVTTLTAVNAATSYRTYYAAGNKLYFGAAQPADLRIAYKARVQFTEGAGIAISDAANGEIVFQDLEKLPNVWATAGATVYMTLEYLPEWPNIGASAQSLTGGTNGITMTGAEKYDALEDAYTALEDTATDIIVPINCYLDDTKVDYDSETGVETEVNAGFAAQLGAHCEQLLDGVSETFGIIAVNPIEPADGRSVKTSDITSWITDLTEYSYSDVTRAANVMKTLDNKHVNVVAFEPVISNAAVSVPYMTSGECLYAGLVAKLPSNSASTNKALSNIVGLRYILSARQLNTLTGARYVTAMNRPDIGIVVTDGVTAAATTSDWKRLSTFRIMVEAMRNVRAAGMPFIGEGFSGARKAALDTAILRQLDSMKQEGKLIDFDFLVSQTKTQEVNGTASVKLILHPAFELRRLEVTVELRQS